MMILQCIMRPSTDHVSEQLVSRCSRQTYHPLMPSISHTRPSPRSSYATTYCAYLLTDGQAELTWLAAFHPPTEGHPLKYNCTSTTGSDVK